MSSAAANDTNSSSQIAAVLFIDIVGFSRLVMNEQAREIRQLADAVRNAEEFKRADAAGRLIILPSGDGMVIVFFDGSVAGIATPL